MPATSKKFRLDCEYTATVKAEYDLNAKQLNPEKVNWPDEAGTLLEFLQRYALPQFTDALSEKLAEDEQLKKLLP
jgi:hypothetical protein